MARPIPVDYLTTLPCERRVTPNPGSPYPLAPNEFYPIFASGLLLRPKNVVGSSYITPLPVLTAGKTLPYTGPAQDKAHLLPLDRLSKLPHIPTRAALH